jgi:hypothetical protein
MNLIPFAIPTEIIDWIRAVFAAVNERTSAKLTRLVNVHETSLDMTLIEQLSQFAAPFRFASDWHVRLETHYLGGPRYWGHWEIADVGVLIAFRRRAVVQATKIALLQSKRLYPEELEAPDEDAEVDYEVGFARLLSTEQEFRSAVRRRTFRFSQSSRYRAMEFAGEQYAAILSYMQREQVPVYYLFHNPLALPSKSTLPVEAPQVQGSAADCKIGCRVVRADALDSRLTTGKLKKGENPSFAQVASGDPTLDVSCWRLEYFVSDLVIGCHEGYLGGVSPMKDSHLRAVFSRRSGPISAAISITIDAPGG